MPMTVERKCRWCKQPFTARVADARRGWARFCSKRCKAMDQEKRTHQFANLSDRAHESTDPRYEVDAGWDAHKDTFV